METRYYARRPHLATIRYKTLFTLYPDWYLDHISGGGDNLWGDWSNMYLVEPLGNSTLPPAELALILGGEVCSWDPYEDGSNNLANAFPRAYAVAERLWSDRSQRDVDDAARRLHILRCLLIGRGLVIAPAVQSSVAGKSPAEPWPFCQQVPLVTYTPKWAVPMV